MSKKIAFCGGGNMAEGIITRFVSEQIAAPNDITVCELRPERCDYLHNTYGVNAKTKVEAEYAEADLVVIALLPQLIPVVAPSIGKLLREDSLVLSIAAGVSLEVLETALGEKTRIARTIPNTLGATGTGYSCLCFNANCDEADQELVRTALLSLGQVMDLQEHLFDAFSVFATAGPMWMYKLIEFMTDAGVHSGFNRQDAKDIVIKNMIGAGRILEMTGEHPAQRVDMMTSPGGVTIEGLKVLQDEGFASAIMKSVAAGVDKVKSF